MDINTIIKKKRKGGELTADEIKYFVGKYTKNEVSDMQAAALMSYMYEHGLTESEMVNMVREVGTSGDVLDLSKISTNVVDKHSTGGIGDKITLILMPTLASLGLTVAKISSEGGFFGSTIDKLSAIPGFNTNISVKEFTDIVSEIGISIISQGINLAPVEQKLFKLRNEIACKDSIPLIAISLMSLKVAAGSNKIVFDITCGSGSYLKDKNSAKKLGKLLVRLGKCLDREVGYAITDMNEPIGRCIGNNLEIKETIKALNNDMSDDVRETVLTLGSVALALATDEKDLKANSARIEEALQSGKAITKFKQMVIAQGGDESYIESMEKFEEAENILPVYATNDGYISEISCDIVGSIANFLGVGKVSNPLDADDTAGIVFEKKVGDTVKVGETVAYVHSKSQDKALRAVQVLTDGFKYSFLPVRKNSRIIEVYKV